MGSQQIERLTVEVGGRAGDPAVIMVHGLGATSNTFTPQLPVLDGRFRVVRPDLPGSGRSPLLAGAEMSIAAFAERLIRIAEVLGIERAHWAGHSLGTLVCQQVAARRPALAASLALFGALIEPPEAARQGLRTRAVQARSEGMAGIADSIVANTLAADTRAAQPVTVALVREMLMRQDPQGYAACCEALADARAVELRELRCPVLLVTGHDDPVAPPSVSRMISERVDAAATVNILDRCGHWTTFERATDVNAALRAFYTVIRA